MPPLNTTLRPTLRPTHPSTHSYDDPPHFLNPFSARRPFHDLPLDILHPILSQLTDRRDWHACTLVSKAFARAATPFLYRTLDSRIISKTLVHHPSTTLLRRPDLAQHVRRVTETGSIHRFMIERYPSLTSDTLAALALCTNLASLTWVDDTASNSYSHSHSYTASHSHSHSYTPTPPAPAPARPPSLLLALLSLIATHRLPLRELTIRTHSDLGADVWAALGALAGLRKVAVWCIEGPPRVLQGWEAPLGETLRCLELGVSVFLYPCVECVPPTILITVLARLPLLRDLRLKGAPASAIPAVLVLLPELESLDTEYLVLAGSTGAGVGAGVGRVGRVGRVGGCKGSGKRALKPVLKDLDVDGHTPSPSPSPTSASTSTSTSTTSSNPETDSDSDLDSDLETDPDHEPPLPTLRSLTVRPSSMDTLGPQKLWGWTLSLVPRPGLERFKLHAFAFHNFSFNFGLSVNSSMGVNMSTGAGMGMGMGMGTSMNMGMGTGVPRGFILELARLQGGTLKEFAVGEAQLTLGDVECLCSLFGRLEVLVCSVASPDVDSIIKAIEPAKNLRTLKLHVQWIRSAPSPFSPLYDLDLDHEYDYDARAKRYAYATDTNTDKDKDKNKDKSRYLVEYDRVKMGGGEGAGGIEGAGAGAGWKGRGRKEMFTLEDARRMMLRSEESRLRVISIGHVQYTGKWVLQDDPIDALEEHAYDYDHDHDYNHDVKERGKEKEKEKEETRPPLPQKGKFSAQPKKRDMWESRLRFVVSADVAEDRWKT